MRARGRHLLLYFSIFTALALMVAACGKKRAGNETNASAPVATAVPVTESEPSLPPLPARELSPELQAVRDRALADASRLRGLAWREEVGLSPLTSWEYGARTQELADALGAEDLQSMSRLAVAGGILPEGTDLVGIAVSFASMTASASYSPPDKQVLLRSDDPKAPAERRRALLTHEFVHALQDQHFDLLQLLLAKPYNFDRTEAVFALIEGDATSIQRRLEGGDAFERRPLEEIARVEDARFDSYRRQLGWIFPPLLTETFAFRYRDGLRFVETFRRSPSAGSIDELFRRPPASTEQVLHPEKYLSGEMPREVSLDEDAFPKEGWQLATSTPLGEIGVRGLLMAGVGRAEAARAAAGWGGDRAYSFERAGHTTLFVWKSVWDSTQDAREFFSAYNALKRLGSTATNTDAGEMLWREGSVSTLVRLEGDEVLIIRGAEADLAAASQMAQQ